MRPLDIAGVMAAGVLVVHAPVYALVACGIIIVFTLFGHK